MGLLLQPTSQTHQHQRHSVDSHQIKACPTPLGIHPFPAHVIPLSHLAGCGVGGRVGPLLSMAASAPLPSLLEASRGSNAAFAPGHVYKGNFTCCPLLRRQRLPMPLWVRRHRGAWLPSLLLVPSLPGAAWAINATYCRQAQRGLFLHPYRVLLQGLFGQWHFAYRFVGTQCLNSSLFRPIFQPAGQKIPAAPVPGCLASSPSPRVKQFALLPAGLQLFWGTLRALLSSSPFPGTGLAWMQPSNFI